ncbi:MAG: primary-amine oxidase [Acidimicrobiales bacterium]|jgi:primary-amine oxidase|nr:primary-amine oxidase [Acidimicrobiales bacterium]
MSHSFDLLTAEEIATACAVAKAGYLDHVSDHPAGLEPKLRYPVVQLLEPDRRAPPDAGGNGARLLEVVVLERRTGLVNEVIVDVGSPRVIDWRTVPGVQPPLLIDESGKAIGAMKADPRFVAAVAARGITDMDLVQVDPWPAGNFGLPYDDGRRIVRCIPYQVEDPTDNGYAHPLEGIVGIVDCSSYEVIDVIDSGVVAVPPNSGRYGAADVGPIRDGLRPLEITQPEGPSFVVDGNAVEWLGWTLRFSFNPIEGLVLHQIAYLGRPILDRASIAEMVVPYGAGAATHWWKNAFDVGEWGLGRLTQSLERGCDCLGEIRYADVVLPDEHGGSRVVTNAVCMHEEDFGILWKHVNLWVNDNQVRRNRRFVISFVSTVGNYDYGFFWYFYLDGTIQLEVKLTGILQTGACDQRATEAPDNGSLLAPGLWAPYHQHLFCARLDVTVDGPDNSVEEIDVVGDVGQEFGNAIVTRATLLETERQAQRLANAEISRRWRILNSHAKNALGQPTSYMLVTASPVTLLAQPGSAIAKRAAFATMNLWVTPYHPDERRPAGSHPNQHPGGAGLPEWTAHDRPIVDRPITLWHTFGVSHVPRPEDWPVMPVEYAGFHLRPAGFFDRNPALDLPAHMGDCCEL